MTVKKPAPRTFANPLTWERLAETYDGQDTPACSTYRAKVPGGWLVSVWTAPDIKKGHEDVNRHTYAGGVTFVPDAGGQWAVDLDPKPDPQP